jgi:hypothetical protein
VQQQREGRRRSAQRRPRSPPPRPESGGKPANRRPARQIRWQQKRGGGRGLAARGAPESKTPFAPARRAASMT